MNANRKEATAARVESRLMGCSSDEEPGAGTMIFPQIGSHDCLVSNRSSEFIRRYFPLANAESWNDWRWQLRNSFTTAEALSRVMTLTGDEINTLNRLKGRLPLRITPYYLSLIYDSGPWSPLRRTMIPTSDELIITDAEKADPLNEMGSSPVPGIVHRYPDRALFTVTQFCSSYCRYCTRSHSVGKLGHLTKVEWEQALDYLREHTEIRDVIISGGDPLTMNDSKIEYLLSNLRAIKHIEILRIGTKVPAVLPQRITPQLVNMLKKYHPLFLSIHFTHPDEMTPETRRACEMLADAGMPLGSQTVLLKGINDDPATMKSLMHKLLTVRVRPYYIYQCDLIPGSSHFRTTIEKGIDIIENLRGHTSGYAVPQFVVDAPGGGGKIPVLPDYVVESGPEKWVLRNYKKNRYTYPNKK
ncbi:MAG TPA: KamA family radical SAM protein [Bacteroidales bacterium]|jgi:lysine 2,3-aminomutase|nr:KamA family radical SAM protein [Bacteroidales bacterium]OPZ57568.1 MAG: L-lysine 2,3-aminomutase [Bacteroidetes bacterium ADurb.BinA012]MBP7036641.1 KamA family radical SAM protein [Bacteroidales bacterium]MBP8708768.1 KamA family radical SAM protein [Bacteroidales bacterium]MZQ78732.1 KamA family radical SAM protein [Bacteroidales bacterium]